MKTIMIMAGGTGGHVFPALAVANVLKQRGVDIAWMGTAKGIEARLVPEAGYPLNLIGVQGLRGNGLLGWLMAPFKIAKAVFEALKIIKQDKPDMVLGLGGFASGPGGLAAWLARKPLVIHEQNAIPGLTNTLLAKLASRVLQGFPTGFKSGKAEWVGNPVRKQIADLAAPTAEDNDTETDIKLLVLGGSLGAKSLNTVLPQTLKQLTVSHDVIVKHQCGERHIEHCQQQYQQADVEADVSPFIEDMAAAYQWADIVVCRAGALTVAELSAAGVPAILVPYPYAVDDHQTQNGQQLVAVGAAIMIDETSLTAEGLATELSVLCQNRQQLNTMARAARTQAKPEAAETIADICMEVCHG